MQCRTESPRAEESLNCKAADSAHPPIKMQNGSRFKKIESDGIIVGITKKDARASRFAHIEVGSEEKGADEIPDGRKYFPCHKCNRNNRKGNLYCIYCGEIFPDVAEKTDSGLEPYEIKCPRCGKTGNKNQKHCIWCGYSFVWTDEDILQEGREVEIEINGTKYRSTDRYLPAYIKDAMVRIKTQDLTKENMEKIFKNLQIRKEESRINLLTEIEKNKNRMISYIMLAGGGVLTFAGFLFLHKMLITPAFFLGGPGILLIMAAFLRLVAVSPLSEDNRLKKD
ncbi:MAG: zinc ribbon domain-containing protein [Candidatus Omnitrophica bacterium]|nr:zinc ribbon domain-containing protein [Candidatus Omnitrophota bacterium]